MKPVRDIFPELTHRQANIAMVIAEECLRPKEIADKLFISITTVQNHIKNIKEILKLKSNMEIVREYYKRQISSLMILLICFQVFGMDENFARRPGRMRRVGRTEQEYIFEN